MPTTIFALTPADVKKKLNPLNERNLFQFDADDVEITEADVLETLNLFEDIIMSRIPERYRQLLRHVDGEVLAMRTATGVTAYQLTLFPVSNVRLFANWPERTAWEERNADDALVLDTDYTVNLTTGAVTLTTALAAGSTLIAEYDHTAGSKCRVLKHMVLNLTAVEWARRLIKVDDEPAHYAAWETQTYSDLKRMRERGDGKLGIDLLDKIDLVNETRANRMVGGAEESSFV